MLHSSDYVMQYDPVFMIFDRLDDILFSRKRHAFAIYIEDYH